MGNARSGCAPGQREALLAAVAVAAVAAAEASSAARSSEACKILTVAPSPVPEGDGEEGSEWGRGVPGWGLAVWEGAGGEGALHAGLSVTVSPGEV